MGYGDYPILSRFVRGFSLLSAYEKSLLLWEKVAAEG